MVATLTGNVMTIGQINYDYPWWQVWPYQPVAPTLPDTSGDFQFSFPAKPTECSDGIHVFPCQRCGECKCGKAKLASAKDHS